MDKETQDFNEIVSELNEEQLNLENGAAFSNKLFTLNTNFKLELEGTGSSRYFSILNGKGYRCSLSNSYMKINENRESWYHLDFYEGKNKKAKGLTTDLTESYLAINEWLINQNLNRLYSKFEFIDWDKRKLLSIKEDIQRKNPIKKIDIFEFKYSLWTNSPSLYLVEKERGCEVSFYAYKKIPKYEFMWDGTKVFETSSDDIDSMINLIEDWVFLAKMPSKIADKYPEINFGKLSAFFEEGKGVEGEFLLSWDQIEEHFSSSGEVVVEFLKTLREKGYDRKLRAGSSMYTFILSRSRRYGLREEAALIEFRFQPKSRMEVILRGKESKSVNCKIEVNSLVEDLLEILMREDIK